MLNSPTSSLASSSSSSSSTSTSTLHPDHASSAAHRRRSVDNGGLNLALNDHSGSGSGKGWGGWEPDPTHDLSGPTDYAELLLAMREQTATTIDHAYPATSTTFIPPSELAMQRKDLILKLANWTFDASHLSPDEVLMCACLLFEALWSIDGMEECIGFEFESFKPFLARISKIYRHQTSYHNFQHAVDVLQAIYCYLHEAGCVPAIDILLIDQEAQTPLCPPEEGKGKAKASSTEDFIPPGLRYRKLWRKPLPEDRRDGLLRRALRNQDIFALYVAAIGHDIAHPGVSNKFLSNAKAPLAELFDDVSVLEKFHCTVLLQVMRTHRMVHLLDRIPPRPYEARFSSPGSHKQTDSDLGVNRAIDPVFFSESEARLEHIPPGTPPKPPLPSRPGMTHSTPAYSAPSDAPPTSGTGTDFRDLLMKTILATDMSVHFKWMPKIDRLLEKVQQDKDAQGREEEVDSETRVLLCEALIKCADISNPSRPPPICRHWSSSLLSEWAEQALLERQLELPVSVTASEDPIEEANGQVGFIETFTKPLLQATRAVIPEMDMFAKQCDANLTMWKDKIRDLKSKSVNGDAHDSSSRRAINDSPKESPFVLPTSPPDISTMFALSLPTTLYTPNSERTPPAWPDTASSILTSTQFDNTDSGHDERVTPTTPSSRPSSPPSNNSTAHRRHTSHTQLPHVSIPATASNAFSPSNSQHAKSSSTASASASSPLFSPRSIPTSSSSPRSDISSGSVPSTMGLQFRPGLRAAYEANGRPKAMKVENRTSWQGSVKGTVTTITPVEAFVDPLAPMPPYVPNGS